jgi:hypothetical protein
MDDGSAIVDVAENLVTVKAYGGTAQKLVTDAWYQYWVTNILPFLQAKGYAGPNPPSNSETTILKGQ